MIDESYNFPDILKDSDFKDTFRGDLKNAMAQFSSALESTSKTPQDSMSAAMKAMHMFRGAAGVVGYTLAMHIAETNHRLAEVAMSFALYRKEDYDQLATLLRDSEEILVLIEESVASESIDAVYSAYEKLVSEIQPLFGDYFIESEADLEEDTSDAAENEEDLKKLIASVEGSELSDGEIDEPTKLESSGSVSADEEPVVMDGTLVDSFGFEVDQPAEKEVLQYFYEEIGENLDLFGQALTVIDEQPESADGVSEVLRLAHSTKGAANSMGMFRIARLMHEFELCYEPNRNTPELILKKTISSTLACCDLIADILEEVQTGQVNPSLAERLEDAVAALHSEDLVIEDDATSQGDLAEEKLGEVPASDLRAESEPEAAPLVYEQTPQDDASGAYALVVDQPAEWDVLQYFYQEMDETLEHFDQALLQIERRPDSKGGVNELLRLVHSGKGAANSMGMFRIAKLMHEFESFFENVFEEAGSVPSNAVSATLSCCDLIREILAEVKSGSTKNGLAERLTIAVEKLQSIPKSAATVEAVAPVEQKIEDLVTSDEFPEVDLDEVTASLSGSQTFRIESAKIDALMNLVGELVISRTRVTQHIQKLLGLSQELAKARSRMNETLDSFAERFEYTNRSHAPSSQSESKESESLASADLAEFSVLEFDQYDDFNVLSRQVSEIGNDTDLTVRQLINGMQELNLEASTLGRFVTNLQDGISSSRLVPIATLFKRLERAVRDAAEKENKSVRMVTEGEDLLLDKSIIDDLFNPLVHLVRNSVAHGFSESEGDNLIRVIARQEGGRAQFSVQDNGSGIDLERVKEVAVSKGLIDPNSGDSAKLTSLLFTEGFSTSDRVSEVAGRGIGLDAVKDTIERMSGFISVNSTPGVGCNFNIDLPLSLAIDRGIYFSVGEARYAILMSHVEQVMFSNSASIERLGDKDMLMIEGEPIPLIDMHQLFFGDRLADENAGAVIVCRYLENRVAVKVSRIDRQEDVVVKGLGKLFDGHRFFASSTIDGNGDVIPIIDVGRLPNHLRQGQSEPQIEAIGGSRSADSQTKILVVDDSVSVRKICEDYLSGHGYQIDTANDGIKALNAARAVDYDLIFTDLEMPRLNGLELIGELRRRPATEKTPIVVITSRSTSKHANKAKSVGATGYISKPFSRDSIIEMVEQYVHTSA